MHLLWPVSFLSVQMHFILEQSTFLKLLHMQHCSVQRSVVAINNQIMSDAVKPLVNKKKGKGYARLLMFKSCSRLGLGYR